MSFSWWLAFGVQQFLVPLISLFATFIVVAAFKTDASLSGLGQILAVSVCCAAPGLVAGGLGYWRGREHSRWNDAGKYIWCAPLCFFAIGFVPGMFVDPVGTLRVAFVIDAKDGGTESGLGVILITFPVLACCAYSAGIKLGERGRRQPGDVEHNT